MPSDSTLYIRHAQAVQRRSTHSLSALLIMIALMGLTFSAGCAQRAHISSEYGVAYQSYFTQQVNSPVVRLAPTTAEDAKRISESRAKRSGSAGAGRSSRFGIIGGGGGSSLE